MYFLRSELIEVGFLDQNNCCLLAFLDHTHIIVRYFEDNNILPDQESLIILSMYDTISGSNKVIDQNIKMSVCERHFWTTSK